MSMCICSGCFNYIDSDNDPDCFIEVGNMRRMNCVIILCERCREEREEAQAELEYTMSMAEAMAEGSVQK